MDKNVREILKNQKTIKCHFLPQVYLRQWTNNKNEVLIGDIYNDELYFNFFNIKHTTFQLPYLYDDDLEVFFGKVETHYSRNVKKLHRYISFINKLEINTHIHQNHIEEVKNNIEELIHYFIYYSYIQWFRNPHNYYENLYYCFGLYQSLLLKDTINFKDFYNKDTLLNDNNIIYLLSSQDTNRFKNISDFLDENKFKDLKKHKTYTYYIEYNNEGNFYTSTNPVNFIIGKKNKIIGLTFVISPHFCLKIIEKKQKKLNNKNKTFEEIIEFVSYKEVKRNIFYLSLNKNFQYIKPLTSNFIINKKMIKNTIVFKEKFYERYDKKNDFLIIGPQKIRELWLCSTNRKQFLKELCYIQINFFKEEIILNSINNIDNLFLQNSCIEKKILKMEFIISNLEKEILSYDLFDYYMTYAWKKQEYKSKYEKIKGKNYVFKKKIEILLSQLTIDQQDIVYEILEHYCKYNTFYIKSIIEDNIIEIEKHFETTHSLEYVYKEIESILFN